MRSVAPTPPANPSHLSGSRWVLPVAVVLLMLLGGLPVVGHAGSAASPAGMAPAAGAGLRAFAGPATLTVVPAVGTVHSTVKLTGAGFAASGLVNLTWGFGSPGGTAVRPVACTVGTVSGIQVKATAAGAFTCTMLVPGVSPGAYRASANDQAPPSPGLASAAFTVSYFPAEVTSSAAFDASSGLPLPPLPTRSCSVPLVKGLCAVPGTTLTPYLNVSDDITLNHTSTGLLAMAYTSYSGGNAPCIAARPYSLSNLVFQSSADNGATWSSPTYLGNPVCTAPNLYPSAWEPKLTSLSDGTLVLAYVQYNATAPDVPPFYNLSAQPLSRLVVTESSNGGTSWSVPTVVNVSNPDPSLTVVFEPVAPSITAFGHTIYLTWMTLAQPTFPVVLSHVAMVVSTTGGKSWSPTILLGSTTSNSANPNVLVVPATVGAVKAGTLFVAYDTDTSYTTRSLPLSTRVVVATSATNGTVFTTHTVQYSVTVNQTFGPFYAPAPALAWTRFGVLDVAFAGGVDAIGGSATGVFFYHSANAGASWTQSTAATAVLFDPSLVHAAYPANASRILTLTMTPSAGNAHGTVWLEATVFNASACVNGACGVDMAMVVNTSNNGTSFSGPDILPTAPMTNGSYGAWQPMLVGEYTPAIYYPGATAGASHLLFGWSNASCPSWLAYPSSPLAECGTVYHNPTTGAATMLWGTTMVQLSTPYTGSVVSVTFTPQNLPWDAAWTVDLQGAGNSFRANGSTNITVSDVPVGLSEFFNVTGPGVYNASYQYRAPETLPSPHVFRATSTVPLRFTAWVPLLIEANPPYLTGSNCQMSYGCAPSYFSPPSYFGERYECLNGPLNYYYTCSTGCVAQIYDDYYYYGEAGYSYQSVGCADTYVSHNTSATAPGVALPIGASVYVPVGQPYHLATTHWSPMSQLCGQGPVKPAYPKGYWSWMVDDCSAIYIPELSVISWFGSGPGNVTSATTNITVTPQGPVTEEVNFAVTGACTGDAEWYADNYTGVPYNQTYNWTTCAPITSNGSTGPTFAVPLTLSETSLPTGITWGATVSRGNFTETVQSSTGTLTFNDLYVGNTYSVYVSTVPDPKTGLYWVGTTNATVTMPDFSAMTVTFVQRSLTGLGFAASVTEQGLPAGVAWTSYVANVTTNLSTSNPPDWTVPALDTLRLAGGTSYAVSGSVVYGSNGTSYFVSGVNVSFSSVNSSTAVVAPGTSVTVIGAALIVLEYAPMYWLSLLSGPGGSVTPSSRWVPTGGAVTLTATPTPGGPGVGTLFTGWTGIGPTAVSGLRNPITVHLSAGPVTEFANFRPIAASTWTIQVQASGLPSGATYTLSLSGATYSGNGSFTITNITKGTYALSSAIVYSSPVVNTRWLPTPGGISTSFGGATNPVLIDGNGTVTIAFQVQYLLTVSSTPGGAVIRGAGGPWFDPASATSLTAVPFGPGVPGTGHHFVGWNGTGSGSYSGNASSITVAMNGPVTELAQFDPNIIPPPRTYNLLVSEIGLPNGLAWNASVGVVGGTGTGPSLSIPGLNGTYTLTVSIVVDGPGVRYAPAAGSTSVVVNANATASVTFTKQDLLTVTVSGIGTVDQATAWVADGAAVTLDASVVNRSWEFSSWTGTMSTPSAKVTLTVVGPTTETAQFVPVPATPASVNPLTGAPVAFGLLAVLLVVGLLAAYLLFRRRPGASAAPPESSPASSESEGPAAESENADAETAGPP